MLTLAVALFGAALVGCGSQGSTSDSLKSADAAEAAKATKGSIGQSLDIGNGIMVTVNSMGVVRRGPTAFLAVDLRVENRSSVDRQGAFPTIRCAGSTQGGSWLAGSTYDMNRNVPANSYTTGVVDLLLPGDKNTTTGSVPECAGPAVVWLNDTSRGRAAYVEIGPEDLAALNAARQR